MSRRARALLAALWVVLAGCSSASAPDEAFATSHRPVVNGALDDGDPAVLALLGRRTRCAKEEPMLLCTGTLIAPRVVLTAAHCLQIFGEEGPYEVYLGARVGADGGRSALVVAARRHPRFDPVSHELDLALLRLAEPVPVALPALPAGGSPEALAVGQQVRVVGFGDTRDAAQPSGDKRQGRMSISSVTATAFRSTPAPSMSCVGDSGGPVFATVGGGEVLAAVTASGDFGCSSFALNVRVDAAMDDFIRPFLEETERTPTGFPGRIELPALCTAPCLSPSDCPAGLLCVTGEAGPGRCVLPGLGDGAYGATCASDAQCGSGTCARLWPEGPDACRCFTPCEGQPGQVGGRGCAAAGTGLTSAAGLLGLVVALLRRRRA